MATIKDIAEEAGVSIATVSNVIRNANSHVSAETVERIQKIMKKLNYTPNMSARALVSKKSKIIGVLSYVGEVGEFRPDPFLGNLFRAIESALSKKGYYMLQKTISSEKELQDLYASWNLTGIIVHAAFEGTFFEQLESLPCPCVLIDSYIKNCPFPNVGIEDFKGSYLATKHLIQNGHKNIAFVSPAIYENGVVRERFEGYKAALKEAGIAFSEENIFNVNALDEGEKIASEIQNRHDITAIFATADMLAYGIMSALQKAGLKIPDDISIVGFDDLFYSSMITPALTTVRQDLNQRAVMAVNVLTRIIENDESVKNTMLAVELIERDSVRKL